MDDVDSTANVNERDNNVTVTLASGGTVSVTPTSIVVQPGSLDRAPDVTDLRMVKVVRRIEEDVTITRVRRRTMQITLASEDDAERLETHIHAALADVSSRPATTPENVSLKTVWLPLGMLVCAVLVVIGSLGPWAKAQIVTVSGTDWDGDLTLTFGFLNGALSGLLLRQPWRRGWTLNLIGIAFALVAMIGIVDWVDVERAVNETGIDVRTGWGLPLMTAAAGIGVALTIAHYLRPPEVVQDVDGSTDSVESDEAAD